MNSDLYLQTMMGMTNYYSQTAHVFWALMNEFESKGDKDYSNLYDLFEGMCANLSHYKDWTEIVMLLNWRSWYHSECGDKNLIDAYSDLFYKAQDKAFELFEGNEEALQYFLDTTD